MPEPTTCARCGITDRLPKQVHHCGVTQHYSDALCIEALGEAVRALQAKLDAPEVRVESGAFAGLVPPPSQKIGGGQADLSGAARGAQTTPIPPDAVEALNRAPEPPATERERDELDEIERLVVKFGDTSFKVGRQWGGPGYDACAAEDREALAALMDAIRAIRAIRAPQGEPDPDLMEAWADWYDEHTGVEVLGPAGSVLRDLAKIKRRHSHRDQGGTDHG